MSRSMAAIGMIVCTGGVVLGARVQQLGDAVQQFDVAELARPAAPSSGRRPPRSADAIVAPAGQAAAPGPLRSTRSAAGVVRSIIRTMPARL